MVMFGISFSIFNKSMVLFDINNNLNLRLIC